MVAIEVASAGEGTKLDMVGTGRGEGRSGGWLQNRNEIYNELGRDEASDASDSDEASSSDIPGPTLPTSGLTCTHNLPKRGSVNIVSVRFNEPSSYPSSIACREFFDALELCHANVWAKWTGGCNQVKRELNKCLHNEVCLIRWPD